MVLLNAINNINNLNFRQFRATQNNGFSHRNLKCPPESAVIEDYYYSTSIAVDQVMEIERYYDAFPALGSTAANYVEKIPLPRYNSRRIKAVKPQSAGPALAKQVVGINGGGSPKLKYKDNRQHCKPKSQNFSAGQPHSHQEDAGYGKNYARRPGNRYQHSRQKKNDGSEPLGKERNGTNKRAFAQKSKRLFIKDPKPWKYLAELKDRTLACAHQPSIPLSGAVTLEEKNPPLIAEDVLETALAEDDTFVGTKQVSYLWGEGSGDQLPLSAICWEFGGVGAVIDASAAVLADELAEDYLSLQVDPSADVALMLEPEKSADNSKIILSQHEVEDGNEPLPSDYDYIEQSLASLKLCEDVPENCKSSKLMPLFRENPFSYMIRHGELATSDIDKSGIARAFTCKHCEETYEIVLESESASKSKTRTLPGGLGLIDSRLDFDWSKYHPPPWSACAGDSNAAEESIERCKVKCDCEFCRLRTWKRTCKWCATPL